MRNLTEKFGSFGAFIAAAACPVCFPKLALFGAIFGLSALTRYEVVFFYGAQTLVVLALVGHAVSYKKHRNWKLLSLVVGASAAFFVSLYIFVSEVLSYTSLIGLIVATVWLMLINRRCEKCNQL
jgi:vacuolar-type H+-ATPase subunit I/STV1